LRQPVNAGLVSRTTLGTYTLFRANQASPVFAEMRSLLAKTVGILDVWMAALKPLEKGLGRPFS
jgi:hypothetical protein